MVLISNPIRATPHKDKVQERPEAQRHQSPSYYSVYPMSKSLSDRQAAPVGQIEIGQGKQKGQSGFLFSQASASGFTKSKQSLDNGEYMLDIRSDGKLHTFRLAGFILPALAQRPDLRGAPVQDISNSERDAPVFANLTRQHWAIENCLHWMPGATFHEDSSLMDSGHAPENLSLVRKIAMTMRKKAAPPKLSIRRKQRLASCNRNFLLEVLRFA